MKSEKPWPWPEDSALDRVRRIAREYRSALAQVAPDRAAAIDNAAEMFGETWVTGALVTTDSPRLSVRELAAAVGARPGTIYVWVHRGVIDPPGPDGLHDLDAVRARLRDRRKGRAA
jgi:hypothetical protein